jgi:hypothetical protein
MRELPIPELELLSSSSFYFFVSILFSTLFFILKYDMVYRLIQSLYIIVIVAAVINYNIVFQTFYFNRQGGQLPHL